MCTSNCSCISCTVVFGQQLANLLHTWTTLSWKAARDIKQILHDIEGSTSALVQLQVILESDKASQTKTFKPAGLEEIETLTLKCHLIFQAVILLIQKAAERKKAEDAKDESDGDSDDSGSIASSVQIVKAKKGSSKKQPTGWEALCFGPSSKASSKAEDDREAPEEEKSELLTGPVPSLTSSKTFGLIGMLSGQWSWLENRIDHCQTQLKWVRKGLLLHLQMGRLTALANQPSTSEESNFDSQVVFRVAVRQLWKSQAKVVKAKARKEEREEEKARRLRELRDKADTVSIHSANSDASDSTVVVEETREPETKSVDDTAETKPVSEVTETKAGDETLKTEPSKAATTQPDPNLNVISPKPPNIVTPALPASELLTKTDGSNVKTVGKLASGIHDMRDSLSETMAEWTQKIFGRADEFSKDWESQDLEAWVIQSSHPFSAPIKVPYGHQRLKYGLKRTRSKKISPIGSTSFTRYIASGPRTHVLLDELNREANRLQNRERIVLAHSEHIRESDGGDLFFLIAFFSIQKEKAPITFTDCIGRKMTLPFETCRTWEGMRANINEAFRQIPGVGPYVMEEHYTLNNAKNEYIPLGLWENTIKPGDHIHMQMNPSADHVLRGLYAGGPPYGTPLRQASDTHAHNARADRLRQFHRSQGGLPYATRRPMPSTGMGGPPPPGMPAFGPPTPGFPPGFPPGGARMPVGRPPFRPPPPPASMSSYASTVDEADMTAAEKRELTFVSFVELLKKVKGVTAGEFMARCTELQDISELMDLSCEFSSSGSSSDSDSTGSQSIYD